MKCAIMQPTYFPWLGYFDLIRKVDRFVIYDHVKFEKQSWQQRNRIRNKQGEIMLILAVCHDNGLNRCIKDVRIDFSRNIIARHLKSIKHSYSHSMNFDIIYPDIENVLLKKWDLLIDLNIELIKLGMKHLSIKKEILFSSELNITGHKVEALVDVCGRIGADEYLSPAGSKTYIEENNIFGDNKIKLFYQHFDHPIYKQMNYKNFISHLSFIDYLFNVEKAEIEKFGSLDIFI